MSQLMSWIEARSQDGQVHTLYLADENLFKADGAPLMPAPEVLKNDHNDKGYLGHDTIRAFWDLESFQTKEGHVRDFWDNGQLPKEIGFKLRNADEAIRHFGRTLRRYASLDDLVYIVQNAPKDWERIVNFCKPILATRLSQLWLGIGSAYVNTPPKIHRKMQLIGDHEELAWVHRFFYALGWINNWLYKIIPVPLFLWSLVAISLGPIYFLPPYLIFFAWMIFCTLCNHVNSSYFFHADSEADICKTKIIVPVRYDKRVGISYEEVCKIIGLESIISYPHPEPQGIDPSRRLRWVFIIPAEPVFVAIEDISVFQVNFNGKKHCVRGYCNEHACIWCDGVLHVFC